MNRSAVAWIAAIALGLGSATADLRAQPSARMQAIGYLGAGAPPSGAVQAVADFQQGLRDGGYVDGKNVVVHYRYASSRVDRLSALATELVALKVNVIVTSGEQATAAAMNATSSIPIVATEFGVDPVKAGFVASLARPEGNLTGLVMLGDDLWPKRFELLKQIAPRVTRLAVLWNPANPGNLSCLGEIRQAAASTGVQVHPLDASDAKALERAYVAMTEQPSDAIVPCWDAVTLAHAQEIARFALSRRMVMLAPLKEFVQAGALISFGANLPAHRRRAAYYVGKILKGAKPADLPVERPAQIELAINAGTAKALGLALSPTLLVIADELIP